MIEAWDAVEAALDRAGEAGRTIRVWMRDDDAVDVTPALERLDRVVAAAAMPVLMAVVPDGATPELAAWVEPRLGFMPCQHGFAHTNHAPSGARACELGGARSVDAVVTDLRDGRQRLKTLFGRRASNCLVPPWNRIDPGLVPLLPALGFDCLSVFGPPGDAGGIRRLNADLDVMDWRHGRVGRSLGDVCRKLADLVETSGATGRPIGLLTHHLAHDATAWSVLETVLDRLRFHPAVAFIAAADAP